MRLSLVSHLLSKGRELLSYKSENYEYTDTSTSIESKYLRLKLRLGCRWQHGGRVRMCRDERWCAMWLMHEWLVGVLQPLLVTAAPIWMGSYRRCQYGSRHRQCYVCRRGYHKVADTIATLTKREGNI